MKRFRIEIPGKNLRDNKNIPEYLIEMSLPETIVLTGTMFIFYNGSSMKIYTMVSENHYHIPQCLEGRANKRNSLPGKYVEMQFEIGLVEFISLKVARN